ncbi:MAG: sulfite exporter TauE/SafE family protein [Bdellovibrionota bacterium]
MEPIWLILTFSAVFTSVISAVIGMAGGIVLLSIMTFFLDLSTIVPIHGFVQLTSNFSRSLRLRQHIEKRILIPTIIGLPIGTFISTQIIRSVSNKEIFYFLIATLIFYVLFKPKKLPQLKIPFWSFGILAIVVGILGPLIGATGPLMAPFYLRNDLNKEQIVATKASAQMAGHLLKVPAFLYLGFDYSKYLLLILLMSIGVIIGTNVGVSILSKINESTFRLTFRTALFIAACRITYKALASLGVI